MTNEAIPVQVPTRVYLDLAYQLRKSGDLRSPDDVVALAIRSWLSAWTGTSAVFTGRDRAAHALPRHVVLRNR
jgi:hypothetical protein